MEGCERRENWNFGIFETFELVGYFPFDRDSFPFDYKS